MPEIKLSPYVDTNGRCPFELWFRSLNVHAAAKLTVALERLRLGNTSHVKSLGSGLYELKIDFGPGYRVYFGHDGPQLIILLAGGTKKRQSNDILNARASWKTYKSRLKGDI